MSSGETRKRFLELAKKIKKESDLGYTLESLVENCFPLDRRAREELKLEKLLEKLAFTYYRTNIYPHRGELHPGYILTEFEIILIKIEELTKNLAIDFQRLSQIFNQESNKAGFFESRRFYSNWNDFEEGLELSYFYKITKRTFLEKG